MSRIDFRDVAGEEEDAGHEETLDESELEGFDDFTLASSWERFISEMEAVCRQWLIDGPKKLMEKSAECLDSPKKLYKVKCDLKCGMKSYRMEYYFKLNCKGKTLDWDEDSHDLQISFGVNDFLIVAPLSASGVVLDAPESCKLLSAAAIAMSNCGSNWPAFVPVHDPSRKAYIGIQNMAMNFTRRFDADRIGSQVPIRLMHMEGLYELFFSKIVVSSDFATLDLNVHCTLKLTYRTPPFDEEYDIIENTDSEIKEPSEEAHIKPQWDDDCPWSEWYSAEDPIKGFELIAIWSSKSFESSIEVAELENASSFDAEKWLLYPIISLSMVDGPHGKLMIGFASQLHLLVSALDMSFEGQFLEDFSSAESQGSEASKSGFSIPPPSVIDRVLKALFHDGVQVATYTEPVHKNSQAIKGAPLDSLFSQFCLQSIWFGNCSIRAIAALWIEFVREVRWCWEESQPLPRVFADSGIDLSSCLVHQKLQMLAICIRRKSLQNHEHHNSTRNKERNSVLEKENSQGEEYPFLSPSITENGVGKDICSQESDDHVRYCQARKIVNTKIDPEDPCAFTDAEINYVRRGSAGAVGSMMLLHSFQKMHAPFTQDASIMTEDMHEERLRAVEAFGGGFNFSGQLEKDILSSDMSAFKAANPNAVFEDFIRWHSPGDWESDETKVQLQGTKWPPRGKLSQRMSKHGNSWRCIWTDSPALPASEQEPLLDPIREGEKVLHYLETLRPHLLLEQMVCTAFRAAADTLNETSYGEFKLMATKLAQLYLTLASTLRPLQGNHFPDRAELISDLKHLCFIFEHIEKLLILAAAIHRKLLDAPHISEAIFNGYFNFYLPKMGTSPASICYDMKFLAKQLVSIPERDAVLNLFPPPTANQSWRKVLSMGNFLNGHEPILREIIFRVYDRVADGHYEGDTSFFSEEIETHRMYICGTSNDLRVALSVTSWD